MPPSAAESRSVSSGASRTPRAANAVRAAQSARNQAAQPGHCWCRRKNCAPVPWIGKEIVCVSLVSVRLATGLQGRAGRWPIPRVPQRRPAIECELELVSAVSGSLDQAEWPPRRDGPGITRKPVRLRPSEAWPGPRPAPTGDKEGWRVKCRSRRGQGLGSREDRTGSRTQDDLGVARVDWHQLAPGHLGNARADAQIAQPPRGNAQREGQVGQRRRGQ